MDRSSSHSNSGSSRTVADTATADHDVEAQAGSSEKVGPEETDRMNRASQPESKVPTLPDGAGPATATASGGDAISPSQELAPNHNLNNRSQSNITTINGDNEKSTMIVNWDGPDDPKNPINFSEAKKWTIMITIGTATLACTCASSMVASTYEGMMEDFNVSREVATLSLTL